MGESILITGEANDERERFEFKIEPFVTTGFTLIIRYSGDGRHNTTAAGVWPTIERAKQVAQETAAKLLHGAIVAWHESQPAQRYPE